MLFPDEPAPDRSRAPWLIVSILLLGAGALTWWLMRAPEPGAPAAEPARTAAPAPEPASPPASPAPAPPRERPVRRPEAAAKPDPDTAAPAAPAMRGVLRVRSDVAGAMVFVDRKFIGNAPLEKADLPAGTRRVNIAAEGFDSIVRDVEIGDTAVEIDAKFKEIRLDESVAVVHKHGMGSCKGRLVATVEGLRYETPDKDAFTVPFSRLETFDVSYLDKNMKVKLAGGKTYNFTDAQGDAAPLFAFFKAVEKVRGKLPAR